MIACTQAMLRELGALDTTLGATAYSVNTEDGGLESNSRVLNKRKWEWEATHNLESQWKMM